MEDKLGDRMKHYEGMEADRRFLPLLPVVARIDGRSFSSFTKGMTRPYDAKMSQCMVATTTYLAKHTNAVIGYTQSDEITLVWYSDQISSQIFFDGRIMKMTSQLAAQATICFYRAVLDVMPEYKDKLPTFDARVWTVPSKIEAINSLLWREADATKNSVSMAARHYFSHKELHGKSWSQMQDMLHSKGINWNKYEPIFKRGVYLQRTSICKPFTTEEIELLPAKHAARSNPELTIERQEFVLQPISLFKLENKEAFVFSGEKPVTKAETAKCIPPN